MPGGKCCPEHTTWNGEQCFLPMTPKGEKSDVEVPPTVCEAGYIAFPSRGRVPKGWDIRTMAGDDTRVCAKGAITSGQSSSSAAEQPGGAKPRVPNLVLTKTSDGSCSPTDGTQAWVCNYTLTLTNTGEAAYSGNIEFDEQFGAPRFRSKGSPISSSTALSTTCNAKARAHLFIAAQRLDRCGQVN